MSAKVAVGNVLPLNKIPEGTTICNVELYPGDKGQFARTSGTSAVILGHSLSGAKTRIRLPSGARKSLKSTARAMVGIVAGGGRCEKPLLKAGRAYHKARAKKKNFPLVRAQAMNPVDHPHGGGEGRQGVGLRRGPKTREGKQAFGVRTRTPKKYSNQFIVSRRVTGKKRKSA